MATKKPRKINGIKGNGTFLACLIGRLPTIYSKAMKEDTKSIIGNCSKGISKDSSVSALISAPPIEFFLNRFKEMREIKTHRDKINCSEKEYGLIRKKYKQCINNISCNRSGTTIAWQSQKIINRQTREKERTNRTPKSENK